MQKKYKTMQNSKYNENIPFTVFYLIDCIMNNVDFQ